MRRSVIAISMSAADKADLICKIDCSSYLIEYDMTPEYKGLLRNQQLGVGAVDVQDPKVESGETVAARIRAIWLAPNKQLSRAPGDLITCRSALLSVNLKR